MSERLLNVNVSVQLRSETITGGWNLADGTYAHSRWQTFEALYPLTGSEQVRYSSVDQSADWVGITWHDPAIPDNSRIVVQINDVDVLAFNVVKSIPHGLRRRLLLKEAGPIQPA